MEIARATDHAGKGLMIAAMRVSRCIAHTGRKKSCRLVTLSLIGALAGMGDALYQFDHGVVLGQVPARYPVEQHVVLLT